MGIEDRLRHTIVIERPTRTEDRTDRNQPSVGWSVVATVRAWVQPRGDRSGRELAALSGAGLVTSTHIAFMKPTDIREADVFHLLPDDWDRYHVDAVRDAAGKGQHFEVDATVMTAGGA